MSQLPDMSAMRLPEVPGPKIFRVTELTRRIKTVLEDEIGEVYVEGEISNFRVPSSGHWYFTLKDAQAQIACVMFRGSQLGAHVRPRDGLLVQVLGRVSVYEKHGQYQMILRGLTPAGEGALRAAFEKLKQKLAQEGLFDSARKKPLPRLPCRIGIVTSPTGAVIRDMLAVLTRRFYNLHVVLAPVRVQGAGAAEEIAAAIDLFNRHGMMDVLIVARGGGSLEDLWAFNEEIVARAMARSQIPIISAVGHETDTTISDFVADLRAPTPSVAAELVIGCKADFEAMLDDHQRRMVQALEQRRLLLRHRLVAARQSYVFREPAHLVRRAAERLDRLRTTMEHAARHGLHSGQQTLDESLARLERCLQAWRQVRLVKLTQLQASLQGNNPLAILGRGYSITTTCDGHVLRDAVTPRVGTRIVTRLARGRLESEVRRCMDESDERAT